MRSDPPAHQTFPDRDWDRLLRLERERDQRAVDLVSKGFGIPMEAVLKELGQRSGGTKKGQRR